MLPLVRIRQVAQGLFRDQTHSSAGESDFTSFSCPKSEGRNSITQNVKVRVEPQYDVKLVVRCEQTIPVKQPDFRGIEAVTRDTSDCVSPLATSCREVAGIGINAYIRACCVDLLVWTAAAYACIKRRELRGPVVGLI
jgi:hypothetical protein